MSKRTRAEKTLHTEESFVVHLDEPRFGGASNLVVAEEEGEAL